MSNREGAAFCLDCGERVNQMIQQNMSQLDGMIDFLTGHMEMATGIPMPRMRQRQPIIQTPSVNTIHIDRSVVGSVNTGTIEKLDVTLSNAQIEGGAELADAMRQFAEAVLSSGSLSASQKESLLHEIEYVTSEMQKPAEARNDPVLRRIVSIVGETAATVATLASAWGVVERMLKGLGL
jgi:hypothetical protein